jgi:hypothetical protein
VSFEEFFGSAAFLGEGVVGEVEGGGDGGVLLAQLGELSGGGLDELVGALEALGERDQPSFDA